MSERICRNCKHTIERTVFGTYVHKNKTIPPNFSEHRASLIVTCKCGCHNPAPAQEVNE